MLLFDIYSYFFFRKKCMTSVYCTILAITNCIIILKWHCEVYWYNLIRRVLLNVYLLLLKATQEWELPVFESTPVHACIHTEWCIFPNCYRRWSWKKSIMGVPVGYKENKLILWGIWSYDSLRIEVARMCCYKIALYFVPFFFFF